jgi:hypothetical protein
MKLRVTFGQAGFVALLVACASPALAQSFRVQCPTSTITHPSSLNNNAEPAYTGPTTFASTVAGESTPGKGYLVPTANVNGAIKCQQISGGDGYSTMADGTQTYMFSFGPLSGVADMAQGLPGTEFPNVFNTTFQQWYGNTSTPVPGDPATTDGGSDFGAGTTPYSQGNGGIQGVLNLGGTAPAPTPTFTYNGAIGLAPDIPNLVSIYDISEATPALPQAGGTCPVGTQPAGSTLPNTVTVIANSPLGVTVGQQVIISGTQTGYDNGVGGNPATWTVTAAAVCNIYFQSSYAFQFTALQTGLADVNESSTATAALPPQIDGHVDPRQIMDVGIMNGNIPAPLMAIDEDDEFFLTLTNVGMIMRPDLFEQHTVHFHGYPNASSFYDGVPDASVAINIGGSFTYYYLAPDAGTYFWHCHITPPEHLQMGMVGQLYVRPRQNRAPAGQALYASLQAQQADLRTACIPTAGTAGQSIDILCGNPLPAVNTGKTQGVNKWGNAQQYVYNDGDGMSAYDVEYPIQMHGFDPNFHFVGMTFNPENFATMKDKYWLLNGRSYPDTVAAGPQLTQSSDGRVHYSQPLNAIINIPVGGKALLRISQLSVSEYHTLASLGIPMHVVGYNAKLLRDQDGNNLDYFTNSITLGGGESLDVVLDTAQIGGGTAGQKFFLFTSNLDHLSNDAENFGGEMTEVNICNNVDPKTKACL